MCALWRDHSAVPVLAIIVMAVAAMRLSLRAVLVLAAALSLGLWLVFDKLWQTQLPWVPLLLYGGFQAFAALTVWYARQALKRRQPCNRPTHAIARH